MALQRLKEYLDKNKIKYSSIVHSKAYTAQEIAALAHVSGKELAKTVIVKKDGQMAMAVMPASEKIDWGLLKAATGATKIEIAGEKEFERLFPDCDIGAMPPFGNLYGMEVYVDSALTNDKEIVFNAGTHVELFRLSYDDFARLVKPTEVKFSSLVYDEEISRM